MRAAWAVLGGLAIGIGVAWWLSRDPPQVEQARRARAEQAAAEQARDAVPSLYRWRDANGVLQVTQTPPRGVHYERIGVRPREGIDVRGDRR
jgi:hypothetical protein